MHSTANKGWVSEGSMDMICSRNNPFKHLDCLLSRQQRCCTQRVEPAGCCLQSALDAVLPRGSMWAAL